LLGGLGIRSRQQMGIGLEDRLRSVAEPSRNDVKGNAVRQPQARMCVPEDVQRSGEQSGRLAVLRERCRELLRMDWSTELVV
jgi:hypothetical protein